MKDKKMLFGITIVFLFLASVGFSYAYFTATIVNKDVKEQVVQTGTLQLTYTDGPEIIMNNIKPGATITKEISVKNTGTLDASYNLVWQELANEIINDEMVIEATCTRLNSNGVEEGTCESLSSTPIKRIKIKENVSIEPRITHKYNITITFKEISADQNYNQGKNFTGTLGINEYVENTPIYCTFDGDMVQGAEYVNGQYTYKYKQEAYGRSSWNNISNDGWGVQLTDGESTNPVTTKLCTYINNKPVVSMSSMFHTSNPTYIDFSSFNTSNVSDMTFMFVDNTTQLLDLSGFDTSNVVYMDSMFAESSIKYIDLTNFDTSNVVSMFQMFEKSKSKTIIGLDKFDTSNVDDMRWMFKECRAKELEIQNFNTSKTTSMTYMFDSVYLNELNLSNFDTSKVTDMSHMFEGSYIKNIKGLENFNTSNVINMNQMFYSTTTDTLDLSSFDTGKVTDMDSMFSNIVTDTIEFSDKFDTSNLNSFVYMFNGSTINKLDLSSFDTSNATSMSSMFKNSEINSLNISNFDTSKVTNMSEMFEYFKINILDISNFDTSKVINMSKMFGYSDDIKTIYASDKFVTTSVVSGNDIDMFNDCTHLVGGNGTKYSDAHMDKEYARIDTASTPGYFTLKNN